MRMMNFRNVQLKKMVCMYWMKIKLTKGFVTTKYSLKLLTNIKHDSDGRMDTKISTF